MRRIGREFDRDSESGLEIARLAGWIIASELRVVGVDLCFAPCVDLDWGVSEVIGDRSFHQAPDSVSELAGAFSRGLRSAGMAAVAKHFPGHGAVVADSHMKLPVDRREYGLILDDMRPYERMIGTGVVAGVMLAHIFPKNCRISAYLSGIQLQLRSFAPASKQRVSIPPFLAGKQRFALWLTGSVQARQPHQ